MKLWGTKSEAVFDWWSVGHVGAHFMFTKFFLLGLSFEYALLAVLGAGYVWEVIEVMLEENSYTNKWFPEKEAWYNRYVGDMLSNLTGFLLAWNF